MLRIKHIRSSRLQKLITVAPSDTLKRAKTLFARYKYRQLPVLSDPSTPVGAITQETFLSLDMAGRLLTLTSAIQPVVVVTMGEEVRKVFPRTSPHRFVLVRDTDGLISGIVTLSDVARARQKQVEAYLPIGEIELQLRKIVNRICPSVDELRVSTGRSHVQAAHELNLIDIQKVLRRDDCWAKLGWHIDREVFIAELDLVRKIRNKCAHYHPNGIPEAEATQLIGFLDWLEELAP